MIFQRARLTDADDRPMFWEPSVVFLKWAIAVILLASAAFLIVLFAVAPEQVRTARGAGPLVLSLVAISAWVLLWRGKIETAVYVLGIGLWAYATGISLLLGGLNSMYLGVYPLIIIVFGWLWGPRAAVIVAALTAATCFGFVLGEWQGVMPARPPTSPLLQWIVQTGTFVFAAVLITHLIRAFRDRIDDARKLSGELNRAQAVAHVGSWVYEIVPDVMRLSAETCRIFGVPEGARSSHDMYLSRVHPDDRTRVDRAWLAALKGGAPFDDEHRILVGKNIRWVRQIAELEAGPDGKPSRSVGTTQDITERKLVEESLQQSEERWKFAIEGSGDGVWDWNLQTGGAAFSKRWKEMLGFAEDEIANHSEEWVKRVSPEDMPGVMAKIQEHLDGKTASAIVEFRMLAKDGSWKWILGRGMVVSRDSEGKPLRLVGTNTDITERKRTEAALRESENRLSAVFQASPIAIVVSRAADGKIIDGNDAALRLYGFERDEAIGRTVADLGTYANPVQRDELVRRFREQGSVERFPLDFRRRSGELGALEVSGRVVELDGEPSLVTLLVDVTERNRIEEELRQTLAFANSLSEAMPLPVFHKDASGRYTGCNSAFTRFIGKTRDEIVGKTVFEVSPQNFAKTYRDKDLDLLHGPVSTQTYEGRVAQADGSVRDVIFHKARLTDSAGNATGIVGVITDITELKQIHARQTHLEAQLRESQKMESLGTLAGGVAHDFNNILAAIMGNAELARQDVGPGHPALESLEEIRKASRRAKDLVQQILAFGRRQKLERKVISLAPVVQEAGKLLRSTIPAGVTLDVRCDPDAPPVLADATQIEQVVLNLCSNAWHAIQGQQRAGVIEVRLRQEMRGAKPFASLTVRDNGKGMDAATRDRIFEPFFTNKPVGEGTGLGLSVVHGILKEHEADIEVSSAPGIGTTFVILFPAAKASGQIVAAPAPGIVPAHGRGKRVLYVDDDESIVFLVTRLLERQGYRVSAYTDPREALAAASATPDSFDLAVTDYSMPGMSGLDVARALKEIRADLPVAMASGYITDELRQQAPAAGVSELIYKPNTVEDLCEAIARLVRAPGKMAS